MSADRSNGAGSAPDQTERDLTQFQSRILQVLYESPDYGLGLKDDLDAYYDTEINHGRLYPNLDTLITRGLVEKSQLDKRTNQYELTKAGERIVEAELDWICDQLDVDWIRGDA